MSRPRRGVVKMRRVWWDVALTHCDGSFSEYDVAEPSVVRQTSHQPLSSIICQQVLRRVFC